MRTSRLLLFLFILSFGLFFAFSAGAAEQTIFGPVKYDVKERYGKPNLYKETFKAGEGLYIIKLQNGDRGSERSDIIEFSVNGVKQVKEGNYDYSFIACFVPLGKENTFELNIKDFVPSGFKRPPATPKFVSVSVLPATVALKSVKGAFGAGSWQELTDYVGSMLKVRPPEAASLAMTAAGQQNEVPVRTDAVRKLSDLKEKSAQDFFVRLYTDVSDKAAVRAEAALALAALGDTRSIPLLIQGLVDPDEVIRIASARGLSFYKETHTGEQFKKLLTSLDTMRKTALIRAVVSAGWKPAGVLIELAESADAEVANTAIELLGDLADPGAAEPLLKLLADPGPRNIGLIITALGKTKNTKVFDRLLQIAADPLKRSGEEAELGEALANFGDMRAADAIRDMAKKTINPYAKIRLKDAYKKLTGKEL